MKDIELFKTEDGRFIPESETHLGLYYAIMICFMTACFTGSYWLPFFGLN